MSPLVLTRRLTALTGVILLGIGCLGTETGNPSETRQVSLAIVLKSSNPNVAKNCQGETETEGSGLSVQNAWLATNYVDVQSCVGADESEVSAGAWNLLHPVGRKFYTGIAGFCGFDFQTRLADASLGSTPAELNGASIWVSANRSDNVPVEIRTPVILNVAKVNLSTPMKGAELVIAIDAASWLAGINFNALVPGADGVVRISPTSNPVVLGLFEQQTSKDAQLRDEQSDDGVIDD